MAADKTNESNLSENVSNASSEEKEHKIELSEKDLREAQQKIEDLIKIDKKKYLALAVTGSLLGAIDNFTGKMMAGNAGFLFGNIAASAGVSSVSSIEEMFQCYIAQKIYQRTSTALLKEFDQRSRSERATVNPEEINTYIKTASDAAAKFLGQKANQIKAYTGAAMGIGITGAALASNPLLAGVVFGSAAVSSVPSYFMLKKLKNDKVYYKGSIDEKSKGVDTYRRQMLQSSNQIESVNAQDFSYEQFGNKQKSLIQKFKEFTKQTTKYTLPMFGLQALCTAGVAAAAISAGLPALTTVAAVAGTGTALYSFNRITTGHFGRKEFIETFATAYKKFKSKVKDFQYGKENINTNANVLQLDHIQYKHRSKEDGKIGERQDKIFFKSDEVITFKPGVSILSGGSGAGKSTLTELLMHSDDLTGGNIKIGTFNGNNFEGKDYKDLNAKALPQNIAMSFQRPEFLETSIDTFIRLGNPNAPEEKVTEIKKLLGIGKENGGTIDDKTVLSTGTKLSGGEQTRIGLAQALIKDSPIMILDEPTSGVDEKMSANIVNYLKNQKDKTIIYITHDPREIEAIGAYQAVDIGKHSKSDDVNTIKSFDLTNKNNRNSFIKFFSDRQLSDEKQAGGIEKGRVRKELDHVHSRMRDMADKRMQERITSGVPIRQQDVMAAKKIKGIPAAEAKKQTDVLFSRISSARGGRNN